ncbi:hypothetical protein [Staphylococcus saprophyticus]|nr:hypothetical protein [Staphylococcus saprophyticus]
MSSWLGKEVSLPVDPNEFENALQEKINSEKQFVITYNQWRWSDA